VFSQPRVKELLSKYVLVQLYTDQVPPGYEPTTSAAENRQFQLDHFKDVRLPLYVIVKPDGNAGWTEVARYEEGKINDVKGFMDFLRRPLLSLDASGK
jgi:hypothetical protein